MSNGANRKKIVFISTLSRVPWGGSEMLWHGAALRLAAEGHAVTASVSRWPQPAAPLSALRDAGAVVSERRLTPDKLRPRSIRKLIRSVLEPLLGRVYPRVFSRWLAGQEPDLVCFSKGWFGEEQALINRCLTPGLPYVVIVQANGEFIWPRDSDADKLIEFFQGARRVFFVSERNRTLLETQLGIELRNAEVVRNPYNVRRDAAPAWPAAPEPVRLACVARLDPEGKGQDLLLQVLASEPWRSRAWVVSFFGKGHSEAGLRHLARRLGLEQRVQFCGHTGDVEGIWAQHHALVLPSRVEGLPIAIVEAMLCGRPVIATDVAGNTEVVEDGVTGFIAEAPTVRHLHQALERAWANRQRWESMGQAAGAAIRKMVPADPAGVFARRLLDLAGVGRDSAG